MDGFALLADFLQRWVVAPVSQQFFSLFDLNGRFGLFFLLVSYTIAYSLFRYRKLRGLTQARSFWAFIGGSRVHFHRSALLDIRYYFVRGILKVALVLPMPLMSESSVLGQLLAPVNNAGHLVVAFLILAFQALQLAYEVLRQAEERREWKG